MKRRSSGRKRMAPLKLIFLPMRWLVSVAIHHAAFALFLSSLVLLFMGIKQTVYADPYFQVSTLRVFPRGILTEGQYAKLEKMCREQNLLQLNLGRLAGFVKSNPRVKEVRVFRKLPKEIEIYIVARQPIAEVQFSPKGDFYLVDEEGVVMSSDKAASPVFVQLNDYQSGIKKLDLFMRYRRESVKTIPAILRAFKENESTRNEKVDTLTVNHLDQFSALLSDGLELKICQDAEANLQKLNAVASLLSPPERSKISQIDLCLDTISVRYK